MADDTLPRLEAEVPRAWDVGLGTNEEIVLTALAPDGCIAFTNYKSEQVGRSVTFCEPCLQTPPLLSPELVPSPPSPS